MNLPLRQFWNLNNYGDEIGPYLTWKLTNQFPKHGYPRKYFFINNLKSIFHFIFGDRNISRNLNTNYHAKTLLSVGSILEFASNKDIVWGSGMGSKNPSISKAKFYSARGPISRDYIKSLGYDISDNIGDPALLLPLMIPKKFNKSTSVTIIPHKTNYEETKEILKSSDWNFDIIDLNDTNVEKITKDISSSNLILSSSLHGIIVGQAYSVKSFWFKIDDIGGDDTKFIDYFKSVEIETYKPLTKSIFSLSEVNLLKKLQEMESFSTLNIDLPNLQRSLLVNSPFESRIYEKFLP